MEYVYFSALCAQIYDRKDGHEQKIALTLSKGGTAILKSDISNLGVMNSVKRSFFMLSLTSQTSES
jgi:hypothetical protein